MPNLNQAFNPGTVYHVNRGGVHVSTFGDAWHFAGCSAEREVLRTARFFYVIEEPQDLGLIRYLWHEKCRPVKVCLIRKPSPI